MEKTIWKFLVWLTLVYGLPALGGTIEGRVVALSDGDTITVLDARNVQYKVRLSGIDAPERKQPFGAKSKDNLAKLVYGKDVTVEWHKVDRYKRIVGRVSVNGVDANLEQVRAGLAWHYKQYQVEQTARDRIAYAKAEMDARSLRRGLWVDSHPVPPWDYRRSRKVKGPASYLRENNLPRSQSSGLAISRSWSTVQSEVLALSVRVSCGNPFGVAMASNVPGGAATAEADDARCSDRIRLSSSASFAWKRSIDFNYSGSALYLLLRNRTHYLPHRVAPRNASPQ